MTALPHDTAPWRLTGRPHAAAGSVYLVGAGPGDPELITLRGHRLLRTADVVVYDRLVHPDLLTQASPDAEMIFVGKAAGLVVVAQEGIHDLLIDRARAGKAVVRLKGGDPFVFGRGSEEGAALAAAGIPFEVVPAVSSAFGVPARAGIPLTHRGLAANFAVVTAHRQPGRDDHDWSALARVDTLVVLMGVAALERLTRTLQDHGKPPSTPVAVVERGTLPDERTITGRLDTIAARATRAGIRAPATIVVGPVVDLRAMLRPLAARDAAETDLHHAWEPELSTRPLSVASR